MGRTQKPKSSKHRTAVIASKSYPGLSFGPATVVANKIPPAIKIRKQATRRKCLRVCSNKMRLGSFHCSSTRSRVSKDQRPDADHLLPQSILRRFMELKQVFDPKMSRTLVPSGDELPEELARLYCGYQKFRWIKNPHLFFNKGIAEYTHGLTLAWGSGVTLQIPSSWSVFENIDWNQDGSFQLRPTDSPDDGARAISHESSDYSCSNSSRASSFDWIEQPSPPRSVNSSSDSLLAPSEAETTVTDYWELGNLKGVVHRGAFTRARARGQWNFLATMSSLCPLGWEPQLADYPADCNSDTRRDYMDFNQYTRNQDMWPQRSFPALLCHWTIAEPCDSLSTVGEVPVSQMLGRILASVVETEMFPAYYEQAMRWPPLLKTQKSSSATYSCRANPQYLGWHEDMCPLLFAAQFSPYEAYQRPGLDLAAWKLEQAFRPTMALLILYYLDTRTTYSDRLPPWMVLFGLVYTESGVHVYEHSPWLLPDSQRVQDGTEISGWTTRSSDVYSSYSELFLTKPKSRRPLFCTLNHIQGHCRLVLEHLRAWEGYHRACKLLEI